MKNPIFTFSNTDQNAPKLGMHFQVGALPVVENQFLKHFSDKLLHNYCSKFFWGAFRSVLKH